MSDPYLMEKGPAWMSEEATRHACGLKAETAWRKSEVPSLSLHVILGALKTK